MSEVSRKVLYEMIREQIKHEDELVNHRQNWLLLSQAFLFALFTSIVTGDRIDYIDDRIEDWIPCLLAVIGIALAFMSYLGILAAFRSLRRLRETWYYPHSTEAELQEELHKTGERFPYITWVGDKWERAVHTAIGTPFLIIIAWGFIVVAVAPGPKLASIFPIFAIPVLLVVAYIIIRISLSLTKT